MSLLYEFSIMSFLYEFSIMSTLPRVRAYVVCGYVVRGYVVRRNYTASHFCLYPFHLNSCLFFRQVNEDRALAKQWDLSQISAIQIFNNFRRQIRRPKLKPDPEHFIRRSTEPPDFRWRWCWTATKRSTKRIRIRFRCFRSRPSRPRSILKRFLAPKMKRQFPTKVMVKNSGIFKSL